MTCVDTDAPSNERQIWVINAVIEATQEQADAAREAIARALCPDDKHPGYCPVPWTTSAIRFEDLDDAERRGWEESFDEDRRLAEQSLNSEL